MSPSSPAKRETRDGAIAEAATLYAPLKAEQLGVKETRRSSVALAPASRRFLVLAASGLGAIIAIVAVAIALRPASTLDALEASVTTNDPTSSGDAGAADASSRAVASAAPEDKSSSAKRVAAADLDDARGKGIPALEALAEKYGDDPSVWKALASAYTKDKQNYAKSMNAVRRLLQLAPERASDPDLSRVLLLVANGPVEQASTALDIMANGMGSRGPDVLYELLISPGMGKYPRDRASQLLRDPAVQKLATPALLIANELRAAVGCDRKPLFARAAKDGDQRALAHLKPLFATKGCSWHKQADCFTCLGDRSELKATVEAITQRTGTQNEKAP